MILFISKCCDYIKYKMLSLSTNKNLINHNDSFGRPEDFDNQEEQKNDLDDCISFGGFKVPK